MSCPWNWYQRNIKQLKWNLASYIRLNKSRKLVDWYKKNMDASKSTFLTTGKIARRKRSFVL